MVSNDSRLQGSGLSQSYHRAARPLDPQTNLREIQGNFKNDLISRNIDVGFESDEEEQKDHFQSYDRKPRNTHMPITQDREEFNPINQMKIPYVETVKVEPIKQPTQVYPKVEPVKVPSAAYPKVEPVKPPSTTSVQQKIEVVQQKTEVVQQKIEVIQPKIEVFQPKIEAVKNEILLQTVQDPKLLAQRPSIYRNKNRASRALDLNLDDENADEVSPLDHHKQTGGLTSDRLERLRAKRQGGTQADQSKRPSIQETDAIKQFQDDSRTFSSTDQDLSNPILTKTSQSESLQAVRTASFISATELRTTSINSGDKPIVDEDIDSIQFQIDFNKRRGELSRQTIDRRANVRQNIKNRAQLVEPEVELSSGSDLTDKKFADNTSIDSDEIESSIQRQDAKAKMIAEFGKQYAEDRTISQQDFDQELQKMVEFNSHTEEDLADDEDDLFHLITNNENVFRQYGEKKLKDQRNSSLQSAKSLEKFKDSASLQSVVSQPQQLKFVKLPANTVETCISIQNEILLVGTNTGLVYAFNINTEKQIGIHKEDGKEFLDNSVTAIDIHQRRPEYCVIGFQKGQVCLINLNQITKTTKLVKDAHSKTVVSIKFCDWVKEKPHFQQGALHRCKECEDVKSWMFISTDITGKVVQNTIEGYGFIMYSNQNVLFDPVKNQGEEEIYQVLAPRMSSRDKPLNFELDNATLVAIGSYQNVEIWVTPEKQKICRLVIDKPKRYPSQNTEDVMPVLSQLPVLAWGFGKTPRFNFQAFPMLAIAWGPIIQIVVWKDLSEDQAFELDGYYIIAPEKAKGIRTENELETTLQSLNFLDESLIVGVTSNQEIRVMLTQKFKEKQFIEPAYLQEIKVDEIMDSRCKMMPIGSQLTAQQFEIEMERKIIISQPLQQSKLGAVGFNQSVYQDRVICLTTGGIFIMHHLNWLESLGDTESSVVSGSWIEIFAKALEIYTGKVKGLRMKSLDEKYDNMKDLLKQMIDKQVGQIITQWKSRVEVNIKAGNHIQLQEDLNSKFQTLIRIVIEFCVEIQEPIFLFDTLLKKFHSEGKSNLFAEELKPYILSGHFAECTISEAILSEQILQHHQKMYSDSYEQIQTQGESISPGVSPAENFEKILINFKFDSCSKEYKLHLIDYCRNYGLTSALMYMCLNCYEEQGPHQALTQLKDFYLDTFANEAMGETVLQREDLQALQTMPANYFDRIRLERSSCYLGLKLLWSARLFLQGKKFPRGFFSTQEWHVLVHDIIELITQDDLIQLLTEIDAEAYFKIISIVFVNPSPQHKYILLGRPASLQIQEQISMSHEMILTRISNYFNDQNAMDPAQIHYLCFIASIAGLMEKDESSIKDQTIFFEVALELLNQQEQLLEYNKKILVQKSKFNRMIIKMIPKDAENKPQILAESLLLGLIEQCKQLLLQNKPYLQKILKAVERTHLHHVQLLLHELNDDYLKCLQLFIDQQQKSVIKGAVTFKGRQDGFTWLKDKHAKLSELAIQTKGEVQKHQLNNFQKEILNQAMYLVKQNLKKTINLVDQVLNQNHFEFVDQLKDQKQLQLQYIEYLLEMKKQEIKDSLSVQPAKQKTTSAEIQKWQKILSLHIRLLCYLQPEQVTLEIEKVIKDNFYPMEECLKIVTEYKIIEAQALLNKKLGNYQQAITLYLQILKQEIDYERLKKELYYLDKESKRHAEKERQQLFAENQARFKQSQMQSALELTSLLKQQININMQKINVVGVSSNRENLYRVWVEKFGKNIDLLDRSLEKIQGICKYHPNEVLKNDEGWQMILTFLFTICFHPSLAKKSYCKRHLKKKMVEFCRCILPFVPFSRIIYGASSRTNTLKFKAVKELVNDVFADKSLQLDMLHNANENQQRDLLVLQKSVQQSTSGGVSFQYDSLYCGLCNQMLSISTSTGHFENRIFDCIQSYTSSFNHSYHLHCLKKFHVEQQQVKKTKETEKSYRCPICYPKSQDVIITAAPETVSKQKPQKQDSDDSDSDTVKKEQPAQAAQVVVKKAIPTEVKREIYREKQMRKFDESIMLQEVLTRDDFSIY